MCYAHWISQSLIGENIKALPWHTLIVCLISDMRFHHEIGTMLEGTVLTHRLLDLDSLLLRNSTRCFFKTINGH